MKGVDAQRLTQELGGLIIELLISIINKWALGGDNSWGLPVMEKYQIKPGEYSYGFMLQVIN